MNVSGSIVVFCLYTQPIWTIIIGRIFFRNKVSSADYMVAAAIILGLLFLVAPWRDAEGSIAGILLAIMGGMAMSGWIFISSYLSKNKVAPITIVGMQNIFQSLPFIVFYPLLLRFVQTPEITGLSIHSAPAYLCVIVYSLSVFILAPTLFYKAAKTVTPVYLGFILLLEPVIGSSLDIIFLGSNLTWNIFVGGFLIVATNAWLILQNNRSKK